MRLDIIPIIVIFINIKRLKRNQHLILLSLEPPINLPAEVVSFARQFRQKTFRGFIDLFEKIFEFFRSLFGESARGVELVAGLFAERRGRNALLAPVAVAVGTLVGIMLRENPHRLRDFFIFIKLLEGLLPDFLRIEIFRILAPLGDSVKRYLARFAILHRIGHETRAGDIVEPVCPAEKNFGAAVIVNGPVPPDKRRTLEIFGYLLHRISRDVGADSAPRPHDVNAPVELFSESFLIGMTETPVDVRAHDERSAAFPLVDKFFENTIADFRMKFSVGSSEVVEKDGERSETRVVHPAELFEKRGVILFRTLLKTASQMDRPAEVDFISLRDLEELFEILHLLLGIRLTPLRMMVRVVLRAVNENVHIMLAHELEKRKTPLSTPRTAIVPFNNAAQWNSLGKCAERRNRD